MEGPASNLQTGRPACLQDQPLRATNRSGAFLGAMGSSFMAAPDVSPSTGDIKTGELLGERVATLSAKFLNK